MASTQNTQLAQRPIDIISGTVSKRKQAIEIALPEHLKKNVDKFIGQAIRLIQNDEKLLKCDPVSICNVVIKAAEFGLELDGYLGHAYAVPYGNKATLQIGYRGFIALAKRSGAVSFIDADVVRDGDQFEYYKGSEDVLKHAKDLRNTRGEMYAAWAKAKLSDGNSVFIVLTTEDIARIKATSKSAEYGDSPWKKHEEQMWMKSAVRRLAKILPMSSENYDLVRAALVDEYEEQGLTIDGQTGEIVDKPSVPVAPAAATAPLKEKIAAQKGKTIDAQPAKPQAASNAQPAVSEPQVHNEPEPVQNLDSEPPPNDDEPPPEEPAEEPQPGPDLPDPLLERYDEEKGIFKVSGTVTKIWAPQLAGKSRKVTLRFGDDDGFIFSCWHGSLIEILHKKTLNKYCVFLYTISTKDPAKAWKNIESIVSIDGVEYHEGVPVIQQSSR